MSAASFNRLMQVQRIIYGDDGFGNSVLGWENHGTPIFTQRADISDQERFTAARLESVLVTRFTVRANEFTRSIQPSGGRT